MSGYIYKFENPINGKVYIGKTKDIDKRLYQHTKVTIKKGTKFGNAISKYGIESFNFNIIVTIKSNNNSRLDTILNSLEKHYIRKYDSFNNGYNCTIGGDGTINFKHSQATISKFRNRRHSKGTKVKMSESRKGKSINRRVTEKWRNAIIQAKSIPVEQYTLDNTLIRKWSSISEAAKYYNISKSCICRVCKTERKSCKGFIWKYC